MNIAKKAKIPVLGGHTIKDKEPKYGMVVTGHVDSKKLTRNDTAQPGDLLVLTKPIGTGITTTGIKRNIVSQEIINQTIKTMVTLNESASKAMVKIGVNACTDITHTTHTLGHLLEMCRGSKTSATLKFNSIPFIDGALKLAQNGVVPGGTKRNLKFVYKDITFANHIEEFQLHMLADAQTSGGLLISVDPQKAKKLLHELNSRHTLSAQIIGSIQACKDNSKVSIS